MLRVLGDGPRRRRRLLPLLQVGDSFVEPEVVRPSKCVSCDELSGWIALLGRHVESTVGLSSQSSGPSLRPSGVFSGPI